MDNIDFLALVEPRISPIVDAMIKKLGFDGVDHVDVDRGLDR